MKFLIKVLMVGIALFLCFLAIKLRTPLLASIRTELFSLILVVGLGAIFFESLKFKSSFKLLGFRATKKDKLTEGSKNFLVTISPIGLASFLIVTLCSSSLAIAVTKEVDFVVTKQKVLSQDVKQLEELGQHFLVGYTNFEEVKTLVEKRAIGGVFITTRNVHNKSDREIQQEIQALQSIRFAQGLSPLWIATDQEGGIVSRLSPPLPQLPLLSSIVSTPKNIDKKKLEVIEYASLQGKELAQLGVNLNFAPVVDLKKGIINPQDKYSQIYQRAISEDKEIVSKVALWYCDALAKFGVRCTIKHFPGLGRVNIDTHVSEAELPTPITELVKDDWVPFRRVMSSSQAFTMLGHVKLTKLDPLHPVSFSERAIEKLIRRDWGYQGVLITDDFCMLAVYNSKDGIENASIKALKAGVDLILIAYDPSLYYPVMLALLTAKNRGALDNNVLLQSKKRLEQNQKLLAFKRALIDSQGN